MISIKILAGFFADTDQLILKSIWKFEVPRIAKTILEKNKVGGSHFLISKLVKSKSNQDRVVLTYGYRSMDTERLETNPHIYC